MTWPRVSFAIALFTAVVAAPALASPRPFQRRPYFEPNAGQAEGPVRFPLRTSSGTLFFTGSEVVLASSPASPLRFDSWTPIPTPEWTAPSGVREP
jgi:hypothetical protein